MSGPVMGALEVSLTAPVHVKIVTPSSTMLPGLSGHQIWSLIL